MDIFKDKKAQGLSMNIIVVAAIALLVMVIVIALFGTKMWSFSEQQDKCIAKGGTCKDSCTPPQEVRIDGDCSEDSGGDTCCILLNREQDDG